MIISLELGHKELKCVCLEKVAGILRVSQTDMLAFPRDIFASQDTKDIVPLIKGFFKKLGISPKGVYFSLYHRDIVFQEFSFPQMPQKEIRQAIVNEVEKLPSFSPGKYVYAYSTYHTDNRKSIKAVGLAFSRNILDLSFGLLNASGCEIKSFDITPLNLLNIFSPQTKSKDVAVILIQDEVSYLLILRNNKCNFLYVANSGLADIYTQGQPEVDKLSFRAWAEEVKRALKSYEVEQKRTIDSTYLIWDNQKIENLNKVLSSSLGRQCSTPKLPKQIHLSKKISPAFVGYTYFSTLGAVVKTLGIRHEFNLDGIWCREKTPQYRNKLIIRAISYILIICLLSFLYTLYLRNKIDTIDARRQTLTEKITAIEEKTVKLEIERKKYLALTDRILKQATFVSKLNKLSWSKTFLKISGIISDDAWLSLFSLSKSGKCIVEGSGLSLDSVAAFMRALRGVNFFENTKLNFTSERKVDKRTIVEFGIESSVNLEIDTEGQNGRKK